MLSLDRLPIEFQCPQCSFYNRVFLRQARLRDIIICRGCKANIQLDDHMNECRNAEQAIRKALADLESTLDALSFTIKF